MIQRAVVACLALDSQITQPRYRTLAPVSSPLGNTEPELA